MHVTGLVIKCWTIYRRLTECDRRRDRNEDVESVEIQVEIQFI